MAYHEDALSETVAHILIAFLVVLVTLLIIASLTGVLTAMLQRPALVVATASQYNTSTGTHIISLYHKQGDAVNLNGTSQTGGSSDIAIMLKAPSGSPVFLKNTSPLHAASFGPGQRLYIYPAAGSYGYADIPPAAPAGLDAGDYTVIITDTKAKVLLHSLTVTIA
jgi:hypothetical protein